MKKTVIIVTLLLAVAILITVGATAAYKTVTAESKNIVTMGNLKIATVSSKIEGGEKVAQSGNLSLMPSREASWIVELKNVGGHDAYVRVSVEKIITLAEGVEGTADTTLVKLNLNTADWTEKEGYYYYNEKLAAGETSKPLFTTVTLDESCGNMYQGCKVDVKVNASATQVDNNGENVFEAVWAND